MRDSLDRFLPFFYSGHSDLPPRNPSPSPHILLKRVPESLLELRAFCEQGRHLGASSSCFTSVRRTQEVGWRFRWRLVEFLPCV